MKVEIWKKYTGKTDHSLLLNWMRDFAYTNPNNNKCSNIVSNSYTMSRKKSKLDNPRPTEEETFENLQLRNRMAQLEKQ
jgi:hypothetical protein